MWGEEKERGDGKDGGTDGERERGGRDWKWVLNDFLNN